MPLVPVKCTVCGAILTINSEKDAAVCSSCGNAFIVEKAINNYNTYNTINADTVVVQGADAEQFLKNSATYIQLGDYSKALGYYEEMVEHFPDDYRGWWGLIRCNTKDFTVCHPNYENILKWFKYTINLIHDESQKQHISTMYKEYLPLQAEKDAKEEIKALDNLLSENVSCISNSEDRMKQIDDARKAHQEERKRLEKDLADKKLCKQSDREVIKGTAIVTAIVVVVAIILFANSKILWGVIVGFVGFILFICTCSFNSDTVSGRGNTSQKTHDSIISGAEQKLEYFDKTIAEQISKEKKEYADLQMTIAFRKAEIKKIQDAQLLSFEERITQHLQIRISEAEIK